MNWIKAQVTGLIFYASVRLSKLKAFIKNTIILRQKVSLRQAFEKKQRDRYLFHQMLKAHDTYKLGEAIVTLAKFGVEGKKEVAMKIAAANERREKKQIRLREKGIEIMMMSPEELQIFKINEWISSRKTFNEKKLYDNAGEVGPFEVN